MSNYIECIQYATDQKLTIALDSIRVAKPHPKGEEEGTVLYFKNIPDSESMSIKNKYRDINHYLVLQ